MRASLSSENPTTLIYTMQTRPLDKVQLTITELWDGSRIPYYSYIMNCYTKGNPDEISFQASGRGESGAGF